MENTGDKCVLGAKNETRIINIEKVLERVVNRLPLWATGGFTAAGLVIGVLITCVVQLA